MSGADVREPGDLEWWCALPDVVAAGPAASALHEIGGVVVARHASGLAWLITSPHAAAPVVVRDDTHQVALLGNGLYAGLPRPADPVAGWMTQVGSAHVVASESGQVRVVADAAGFRRVFTARVAGVAVAASHAGLLRRLINAPLDRAWLAAKLASPEMPSVLRQTRSPFLGINPVPAGYTADLDAHRVRLRRWWHPPTPRLRLDEGAALLRAALDRAVCGRVAHAGAAAVSVQLSGGLDSTALAVLATAERAWQARGLVAVTTAGVSPVDDDLAWARRAASALPGVEHRVFTVEEMPGFFSRLDEPGLVGMDEPCSFAAGGARQRHVAHWLAGRGVRLNFNGQGGDEVLLAPWSFLAGLLRGHPRRAWRQLRGMAALRGLCSASVLARAALGPVPFDRWAIHIAGSLRRETSGATAVMGWEAPPLLPPWATPEAAELAATAITEATTRAVAGGVDAPASTDVGVHTALVRIRASAYRAALYRDAMTAAGAPTVMPFFDHAVVQACLATRPDQRSDPWQPKPLLRAALCADAPHGLLARRPKGHCNHDIYRGWHTHRDQVRDLLGESQLVALGLADANVMHRELDNLGPGRLPPAFVTDLVAIETWLRDLPPIRTRAQSPGPLALHGPAATPTERCPQWQSSSTRATDSSAAPGQSQRGHG